MDFTVILVLYIFLLPSARPLSELDFAHILSSTTHDWVMESAPIMVFKPGLCDADSFGIGGRRRLRRWG